MATRDYRFVSRWLVAARREEVVRILEDAESLPRWWGDVYLAVEREPDGVFQVHSRGWLPYTLRWRFRRTDGLALRAWGDLEGSGEWQLTELGGHTVVTFTWSVRADKPLLRYGSWLLKPVFAANHRWAMRRGEEALRREVMRRRLMREVGG